MNDLEPIAWIERESEAFASVLDGGRLDARVPGCPAWTLRDLASHLGTVQRFWSRVVRAGADREPERRAAMTTGTESALKLAAWARESARDLLDALRAASFDTPAWTWWRDNRTVGAIARHQVQEAAVHRWDAESAVGTPDPLAPEVADDGIDEFLWILRQMRGPAPITLVATDSERSFAASDGAPAVTVSASASDLVLLLYGRIPPERVRVDGDRATLDAALIPIG
jgi:uncharacterized protein (TIGR03083 family)